MFKNHQTEDFIKKKNLNRLSFDGRGWTFLQNLWT
jgi:hypothetical protein